MTTESNCKYVVNRIKLEIGRSVWFIIWYRMSQDDAVSVNFPPYPAYSIHKTGSQYNSQNETQLQ